MTFSGEGPASTLHAIVRGRVQGVGFRFFVERRANALGLSGWVRNLPDGVSVEVMAEGRHESLEALLADLRRGPRLSQVESVDATWPGATASLRGFEVR